MWMSVNMSATFSEFRTKILPAKSNIWFFFQVIWNFIYNAFQWSVVEEMFGGKWFTDRMWMMLHEWCSDHLWTKLYRNPIRVSTCCRDNPSRGTPSAKVSELSAPGSHKCLMNKETYALKFLSDFPRRSLTVPGLIWSNTNPLLVFSVNQPVTKKVSLPMYTKTQR